MASDKPTTEEVERAIRDEVARRLEPRHGTRHVPTDNQSFEALGLGSLDLLELVDSLETTLCANPFEQTHSLNDMRTVGDLCHAYRTALCEGAETTNSQDDILLASMRRAGARRRLRTP